jgi:hypothetical protein
MANPNGKRGSQKHQDVQKAEYEKLSQEYDASKTIEVAIEVTVSTPNGKKNHRIADVAAYSKGQAFAFYDIVQIGKTDKNGNPVKREQEAIEDIEAHTNLKVKFVDYENDALDETE